METADTIFRAVAHPTRRKLIALLSAGQRSVKELTEAFDISQPAISQHLRELREAKLVTLEHVGQEHRYKLAGEPLRLVYEWSSQYRRFFDPAGHSWEFVASERTAKAMEKRKAGKHDGG